MSSSVGDGPYTCRGEENVREVAATPGTQITSVKSRLRAFTLAHVTPEGAALRKQSGGLADAHLELLR